MIVASINSDYVNSHMRSHNLNMASSKPFQEIEEKSLRDESSNHSAESVRKKFDERSIINLNQSMNDKVDECSEEKSSN